MQVVAIQNFEHDGKRNIGDAFEVSDRHAEQLKRAGLVSDGVGRDDPTLAVGAKSSALPAAQASQQTTAKKSKRGVKPRAGAA